MFIRASYRSAWCRVSLGPSPSASPKLHSARCSGTISGLGPGRSHHPILRAVARARPTAAVAVSCGRRPRDPAQPPPSRLGLLGLLQGAASRVRRAVLAGRRVATAGTAARPPSAAASRGLLVDSVPRPINRAGGGPALQLAPPARWLAGAAPHGAARACSRGCVACMSVVRVRASVHVSAPSAGLSGRRHESLPRPPLGGGQGAAGHGPAQLPHRRLRRRQPAARPAGPVMTAQHEQEEGDRRVRDQEREKEGGGGRGRAATRG